MTKSPSQDWSMLVVAGGNGPRINWQQVQRMNLKYSTFLLESQHQKQQESFVSTLMFCVVCFVMYGGRYEI